MNVLEEDRRLAGSPAFARMAFFAVCGGCLLGCATLLLFILFGDINVGYGAFFVFFYALAGGVAGLLSASAAKFFLRKSHERNMRIVAVVRLVLLGGFLGSVSSYVLFFFRQATQPPFLLVGLPAIVLGGILVAVVLHEEGRRWKASPLAGLFPKSLTGIKIRKIAYAFGAAILSILLLALFICGWLLHAFGKTELEGVMRLAGVASGSLVVRGCAVLLFVLFAAGLMIMVESRQTGFAFEQRLSRVGRTLILMGVPAVHLLWVIAPTNSVLLAQYPLADGQLPAYLWFYYAAGWFVLVAGALLSAHALRTQPDSV